MANEQFDVVTLEERISQLEKVFFTGLELMLGTGPATLDEEKIDSLFDAYDLVVSKSEESEEGFQEALKNRNQVLEDFRDYVVENFKPEEEFDLRYEEVREEILEILLGQADFDHEKFKEIYEDLQDCETGGNQDMRKVRKWFAQFDENSLLGNVVAAYENEEVRNNIEGSAERIAYFSQLATPFLEESRLANVLSQTGSIVSEIYFGVCEGDVTGFTGMISETKQLIFSNRYSQ